MKGWIDRVFQAGFAFTYTQIYGGGPLEGKKAMLLASTGSPEALYSKGGLHGDLTELLTSITKTTLEFAGFNVLPSHFIFGVHSREQGTAEIERFKKYLLSL